VPERALVFELRGPVDNFEAVAVELGFEFLVGENRRGLDSEEAAEVRGEDQSDSGDERPSGPNLYLTMPSEAGLKKLLARWKKFTNKEPAPPGLSRLWTIFGYLTDLRTWSAKDRIDPAMLAFVQRMLDERADEPVTLEIDLWFRVTARERDKALATLRQVLAANNGRELDLVTIEAIRYQGILISVPANIAQQLVQGQGGLAHLDEIMTIRPQSDFDLDGEVENGRQGEIPDAPQPTRPAIAAILDGFPVDAHEALAGRIDVVEVDARAIDAPVDRRAHGTAMASLVTRGDLHAAAQALDRRVAVVPVLTVGPNGRERAIPGKLPIGVIYRALQTIVGEGRPVPEALKSVVIINHSLCDTYAPFVRRPSPWAALLDHFSYKHRLIFVVSAGNINTPFELSEFEDVDELRAAEPGDRQLAILLAVEASKGTRGLLSPAEAMNAITVGAIHAEEAAPPAGGNAIDPYPDSRLAMPNLASALGLGINRCIKPDVIANGGRFAAGCSNLQEGGVSVGAKRVATMGQLVASPSRTGDLTEKTRLAGTSNAAALTTRACINIASSVEELFAAEGVDWLTLPTRASILRALVAHGCSWGVTGEVLEEIYPPAGQYQWSARRDTISRFLGYGRVDPDRVMSGAANRITLLAEDSVRHQRLNEYKIPIPPSMLGNRDLRTVVITLAYMAPVKPELADYRGVALKVVSDGGSREFWKNGVDRVRQPNSRSTDRGTLCHFVLQGETLKKVANTKGEIFIGVQAMARHVSFNNLDVPYALAITLEVAQSASSKLYAQVQEAVQARAQSRTRTRQRS
jgi:Subtilase family